jgi:uncharacterized protein DUF5069
MIHAKDLSKEPPRGPRERIGGYPILARMIDKGRAALNGTTGEYEFNCGMDQMLFRFKGIDYEEVKQLLASGASDDEVLDWINSHGIPKTSAQIEEFSTPSKNSVPTMTRNCVNCLRKLMVRSAWIRKRLPLPIISRKTTELHLRIPHCAFRNPHFIKLAACADQSAPAP